MKKQGKVILFQNTPTTQLQIEFNEKDFNKAISLFEKFIVVGSQFPDSEKFKANIEAYKFTIEHLEAVKKFYFHSFDKFKKVNK